MDELTREQEEAVAATVGATQRIAMAIVALPKEQRTAHYALVPRQFEATITEFGIELDNALIPLARWGKQHAGRSDGVRPGRASAIAPHAL